MEPFTKGLVLTDGSSGGELGKEGGGEVSRSVYSS